MHNPELIACAGEAPRSKRQVQEFAGLSAFASLSAVFAAVCGGATCYDAWCDQSPDVQEASALHRQQQAGQRAASNLPEVDLFAD